MLCHGAHDDDTVAERLPAQPGPTWPCRIGYDRMKPRPMPPPPSSSAPRTRPAHGSGVCEGALVGLASVACAGWAGSVVCAFAGVTGGFFFAQAGAPSIAPANTTVRQIVWVAFMASSVSPTRVGAIGFRG